MQSKTRRYDIDWIRVIVFDLLIFYHVGMLFVPWGFHLKNDVIVEWITWPMIFVNQWRLPILFVVSGIGTSYALSSRSGAAFALERFKRLFIPLVVGILIIVPPQVYLERIYNGANFKSFLDFYRSIFNTGPYPEGNFSWHHLWFLPYLFLMSLASIPLFLWLRKEGNPFIAFLKKTIDTRGWLIYIFAIPLVLVDLFLEGDYPVTHALIGDWYALSWFFTLFIYGFLLVRLDDVFWTTLEELRYVSIIIGSIALPILVWLWYNLDPSFWIPIARQINCWAWILAIFGFASKYLNKPNATLAYRNRAVSFYILHQTVMIVMAFYMVDINMHYGLKMVILVVGVFGITWIIYEFVIRSVKLLPPLFGIK
ncbi:MAG: glucan biosynthesis protein C [Arcticibacterium sp.]|jgi:glucan biosynthesis protein C